MIFQTFQKYIIQSYSTFPFKKPLPPGRNTLIERVFSSSYDYDSTGIFLKYCLKYGSDTETEQNKKVLKKIIKKFHKDFRSLDKKKEAVDKILNKHSFFSSVIKRTNLLKYNYDFLIRHFYSFSYEYDINIEIGNYIPDILYECKSEIVESIMDMFENDPNNLRNFFHPILVNGFLVLRLKLNPFIPKTIPQTTLGFPNTTWLYSSYEINLYCKKIKKKFAKSPGSYDTNPLTDKITKNKEITFDNINSENLSSDNNASSQEKVSFNKYKKNRSLLKHQNTEDVFAPYGHLWTFCKNCEKSIYKEYAQKNKYICQHCAFHLPMGSLDRIESLIDSGTWDPTDENIVSIDPYDILRKSLHIEDLKKYFEQCKKSQLSFFLDTDDKLQDKEFDYFDFREIWKMYLCIFYQNQISREIQSNWYLIPFNEVISRVLKIPINDDEYDGFDEEKELQDLLKILPSDEEELDSEGLDPEESTVEQTSAEESTAEQVSAEQMSTNTDEFTAEKSIIKKKPNLKELVQLFFLEEKEVKKDIEARKEIQAKEELEAKEKIEAKKKLEEKEKNLASADDENANQNSEKSTKSKKSEKLQKSEKDIPYIDKVHFSQRKTGLTDAIQTGIGELDGIPVALAVMDFQFIGGSMGSVVGEKITRLIESARVLGLPIIISCASGGARMQEGSFSLMQMAKISSILLNYPFFNDIFLVSLLTSPTTGGVTASFGMLGDIIIGEPEAYIAFAGKRVIEQVMKIEVPPGIQEAEYLFEKGSLDSIVPRNLLKGVLSELFKFHPSLILKAMRKKRNWRV